MTKRSERLAPIARLAEHAERRAAAEYADTRQALERCEAQLRELRAVRADYLLALNGPAACGVSRMRELRYFLGRLDAAIAELEWQLRMRRTSFERRQADWLERRARTQALGEVLSRARATEQRVRQARDEREIDDRPRPRR